MDQSQIDVNLGQRDEQYLAVGKRQQGQLYDDQVRPSTCKEGEIITHRHYKTNPFLEQFYLQGEKAQSDLLQERDPSQICQFGREPDNAERVGA